MRYNGRALALPACAKQGRHLEGAPELCTLDAFKKAIEKVRSTTLASLPLAPPPSSSLLLAALWLTPIARCSPDRWCCR